MKGSGCGCGRFSFPSLDGEGSGVGVIFISLPGRGGDRGLGDRFPLAHVMGEGLGVRARIFFCF